MQLMLPSFREPFRGLIVHGFQSPRWQQHLGTSCGRLSHQELEKLEDELLKRFIGKTKQNTKSQKPTTTTKTKESYQGVDSVHTSVQRRGGSNVSIPTGGNREPE